MKFSEFNRNLIINLLIFGGILGSWFCRGGEDSLKYQKAYLDPGTGSMIISAIVGIFATIVLGIKTLGYKISGLFKKKSVKSDSDSTSHRV